MKYNHPITRFPPYNLFFLVSRFWNNQTSIQYLKNKILLLIAMIELKYDINTYPLQFHTILWKIIYTLRLHETYIYISATMAIFVFLLIHRNVSWIFTDSHNNSFSNSIPNVESYMSLTSPETVIKIILTFNI